MERRVLVTGGAGQLGTAFRALSGTAGFAVTALGRGELDVTDPRSIAAALDKFPCDAVINGAAFTDVDGAEGQRAQAFAVNGEGAANLARACAERGLPLVQVSTDYVFDGAADNPYGEEAPTAPLNVYGESKLAGEAAVRELCARHLIVRTSWLFGATGKNFLTTMLRLAETRDSLTIVDDQQGCPTPAMDLARALLGMLGQALENEEKAWGTYHLCSGRPASWYAFAGEIFACAAALGRPVPVITPISSAAFGAAAVRPAYSVLDCGKAKARFGVALGDWQPGLEAALSQIGARETGRERA